MLSHSAACALSLSNVRATHWVSRLFITSGLANALLA